MVLLGGGGTANCAHPAAGTSWARPPGGAWSVAPFDDLFCADPYVEQLTTDGRQWLRAGTGFGEVAFTWTSVDGLAWHDATPPAMRETGPRAAGWTGSEFVVLAVSDAGTDGWTSADGQAWKRTRNVIPVTMGAASIAHVGDALLALVQDDVDATTMWQRAADGTWAALTIPGLDPSIELRRMLVVGDNCVFLAVQGNSQLIVTWRPGDPTATVTAGPPEAIDLLGFASTRDKVVVLGGVGSLDERLPAAWSAPASMLP
jgi:hypothetical protein